MSAKRNRDGSPKRSTLSRKDARYRILNVHSQRDLHADSEGFMKEPGEATPPLAQFSSLPPASEGWGKVMFSVCPHLGGVVSQPTQPGEGGVSVQLGESVSSRGGQSSWGGGGSVSSRGGSVQLGGGGSVQPGGSVQLGGQSVQLGGGGSVRQAGVSRRGGGSAKIGQQNEYLLHGRRTFLF